MMHTITTRAPTEDELRAMSRLAGLDISSYGCLTAFFGILPVFVFGVIGSWVGSFSSPEAAQSGRVAGWIVAVTVFVYAATRFVRFDRRRRRRARRDLDSQQVQEVHVVGPRVIEITPYGDGEPVLAFQIGEDQILFLEGQWIREGSTYGVASLEPDDAHAEFFNSLPPPCAFPSTEFVVTRLPYSGHVFGIRNLGEYIRPDPPVVTMERNHIFGDSELFTGRLDDIAGALRQEHQKLEEE